ncbi:MAG: malto-oligosyltrehalose synthase [Oscillatoriales cyanobacterium SM2_2_1]|nr:malto-oligosyltrehalose synthase [Oscillatoriales cyanobacterium SM2_2_1]
MRIPTATYRLQLNNGFPFAAAQKIIPYLQELGITDVYGSPIFKARAGSVHGYDIVDPNQINPELGGEAGFRELIEAIAHHDMGWLQDIVPNHMAFDSQNQILVDLLENGPDSQYISYFDIDWNHPYHAMGGRVLAPFLGDFYGDCLEKGELHLDYDSYGFSINYYHLRLPLKIESYSRILTYDFNRLRQQMGRAEPDFVKFLGVLYSIKYLPAGEEGSERYDQITFIKSMLWELWQSNACIQQYITENLHIFNGEPSHSESFELLDRLLSEQFFRLSYWKVGNEELNYRRFFTVNDLISVRVEDDEVFKRTHELIFRLVAAGDITGLRIDHIDGLYDPKQYLERLRSHLGDTYMVIEKILEGHEELPSTWPCQGTTGYDFLARLNGIFIHQHHEPQFTELYGDLTGVRVPFTDIVDEKKRLIIAKHLAGDIDNLGNVLKEISTRYRYASDFTIYGLKGSLIEIMAAFPVYRTYINDEGLSARDRHYSEQAIQQALQKMPVFANELDFISRFLFLDFDRDLSDGEKDQWLHFTRRLQQFTGPLTAKGVEDTAMYVYNRMVSLNEVGSDPGAWGSSLEEFHQFNQRQNSHLPHGLVTTATHDTKRGEDLRARLNVLSELPDVWRQHVEQWQAWNQRHKSAIGRQPAPDTNDEYLLYQTLVGAFCFDPTALPSFGDRLKDYLVKAIRESKVHTGWLHPDSEYEQACLNFVTALFAEGEDSAFWADFLPFQRQIAHYGVFNSLAQVVLKVAAVGVPDFYQGSELWDLSLVDPDNRRPVDYEHRQTLLQELKADLAQDHLGALARYLAQPSDGKIKLFVTYRALQVRQELTEVFQKGEYLPLQVIGSLQQHVIAFARIYDDTMVIAVAPRWLTALIKDGELPLGDRTWHETRISLPTQDPLVFRDGIAGHAIAAEGVLWLRDVLAHAPVALLMTKLVQAKT